MGWVDGQKQHIWIGVTLGVFLKKETVKRLFDVEVQEVLNLRIAWLRHSGVFEMRYYIHYYIVMLTTTAPEQKYEDFWMESGRMSAHEKMKKHKLRGS